MEVLQDNSAVAKYQAVPQVMAPLQLIEGKVNAYMQANLNQIGAHSPCG
eukprot:SAG11_NODE_7458_length_1140_cov_9.580211_2_plen_49_part_00